MLIKEELNHKVCLYCLKENKKKESQFEDKFHYLTFTCEHCNKINRIKVNFLSSGINKKIKTKKKKISTLEKIIIKDLPL